MFQFLSQIMKNRITTFFVFVARIYTIFRFSCQNKSGCSAFISLQPLRKGSKIDINAILNGGEFGPNSIVKNFYYILICNWGFEIFGIPSPPIGPLDGIEVQLVFFANNLAPEQRTPSYFLIVFVIFLFPLIDIWMLLHEVCVHIAVELGKLRPLRLSPALFVCLSQG